MKKYTGIIFLVDLCLIFTSGCTNFDARKTLEVDIPQSWQEKRKNESRPQRLEFGWWRSADDQILNQIIEQILAENLSIKQAYLRIAAARQDAVSAQHLPDIKASPEIKYGKALSGKGNNFFNNVPANQSVSYYNASLDAAWEIPLFGQFGARKDQVKSDIAYATADLHLIKTGLISEAIKIYSQIRLEQNRLLELEKIVKSEQEIFGYNRIKNQVGFADEMEVSEAEKSYLSALLEQSSSREKLISYQRQLAVLLGETAIDEKIIPVKKLPDFLLPQFTDTPADVVRNRPDIQKSEAVVLNALAQYKIARSELFPQITLQGSLILSDNLINEPIPERATGLSSGLMISIPLFDWGKRLANSKIKNAKLFEAVQGYKENVIKVVNEAESFLSAYIEAQNRQQNSQKISKDLQKINSDIVLLNHQGFKDKIEVEKSVVDSSRAQIAWLESRVETIISLTSLTKSLGGYYQNSDQISFYEK